MEPNKRVLYCIANSSSPGFKGFPSGETHVLQGQLVIDAAVVTALQFIVALGLRISLPGRSSHVKSLAVFGMVFKENHENF